MEHYRLRKYRSPEVWARVRTAYEEGQSGPDVARRFDVGLANLRKKAVKEEWTRTATAARLERERAAREGEAPDVPVEAPTDAADPAQAAAMAVARASTALAQGRAGEAQALLKAAEALVRLTGAGEDGVVRPVERPLTPEEDAAKEHERREALEALWASVEQEAAKLAEQMLADVCHAPANYSAFAYRWRARVLGPDCEAADKAELMSRSSHAHRRYWDEDGALRPAEETMEDRWGWNRLRVRVQAGLPAKAPDE